MARHLLVSAIVCLSFFTVNGRSVENSENGIGADEGKSSETDYSPLSSDFKFLYRVYSDCAKKELSSCLKTKLVTAIDRASRSPTDLKLMDGINFVRNPSAGEDVASDGKPLNEAELEESLPRDLEDKEDQLDGLIMEKILGFFKTHTLQFKLAPVEEFQRSLAEEGRKKMKKSGGLLLLPLMMASMFVPIALGGLAILAGKALIISKLALVLAGILGLKKLLSSGHGHEQTYHVSAGHRRNLDDSHDLAYRGYVSQTK